MSNFELKTHTIEPVFNIDSKILILGSFPSVKSLEAGFFYMHPQNRFWKVLAKIFNSEIPATIEDRKEFLLKNNIALWDVICSCNVAGSADSSIKDVKPNDLNIILKASNVKKIFVNGKTAEKYYKKFSEKPFGISAVYLPSTSPANAAFSEEKLVDAWQIIKS